MKVVKYAVFVVRKRVYASGKISWRLDSAKGEHGEREVTTYASEEKA
ncbi:MAG: hypothetical protein NTY53_26485 [Kiritimatiellaeota bacterium]|nr:hypothetical protein [Kiritimatiellota bacterium]